MAMAGLDRLLQKIMYASVGIGSFLSFAKGFFYVGNTFHSSLHYITRVVGLIYSFCYQNCCFHLLRKFSVEAGHEAIIFDRLQGGTRSQIYKEGLNWKIPLLQV
jgi:hypothetical protein